MTFEILQPGHGDIPGDHYLRSTPETVLWGRLPCETDAAVLRIPPGETVTIDTVSHEGILEDHGKDPLGYFTSQGVDAASVLEDAISIAANLSRDPAADGPHVVTGPIFVEGAEPGDLLRITVEKLVPRVPYGVISNRHGKGALVGELPRGDYHVSVFTPVEERDGRLVGLLPVVDDGERVIAFPLSPFLGTMGVAVAGDERPHSVPPGSHGGNIDINLLVEGTALYLPVQVAGALAYVGDPHFAQGDGEVALTALEASLRATLRFDVIPRAEALAEFGEVTGPLVRTPEYLVPTGPRPRPERGDAQVRALGAEPHRGALGRAGAPRLRVPQRRDRLRHLAGRRHRVRRARAHPRVRLRGVDRSCDAGSADDRPAAIARRRRRPCRADLLEAFTAYERAIIANDLDVLDAAFAPGDDTMRGDAAGLLVGHDAISAFRGVRGGVAPRVIERIEHRELGTGCRAARVGLALRRRRHRPADPGLGAHRRSLAHHRRPRHPARAGARPLGVAHGRRPALAGRVGGRARRPHGRRQGSVRDQGLPHRRGQPDVPRRGARRDHDRGRR